ncbi:MAG: hypothetical protein U9O59_06040 [Actinomycetota bacterium]|nr:hypothetical protein [Actinomycetota bacterium]
MNLDIPIPYNYKPYPWEIPICVAFQNGKEIWATIHRRGGKDLFSLCQILLPEAFEHPGTYQYVWPSLKQGRDSFWEGKDEEGRDVMRKYVPEKMILHKDNADMKLTVASVGGTSLIQVFGTNNKQYIALRGKPSNGAVFTEFAYQDPRGEEVITPMIRKTGGWRAYNSTPNGNNHYKERYYRAKKNKTNCYTILATVEDTFGHDGQRLVTEADLQKERDDGKSEDYINQEYYCSFNQGIEGTYIGRELQDLATEGKITKVPYEKELLVDTYWDLGITKNSMAVWFVQQLGNEVRFIDFEEATGKTFAYWAGLLKSKGYLYRNHWAPPDVKVKEMVGKGFIAKTRLEHAADVGIHFELIEKCSFENSVEVLKGLLPNCWFDEEKTHIGRQHLEMWGRVWNDILQKYTDAENQDGNDHAGAAARYAAISIRQIGLYKSSRNYNQNNDQDYVKKHSSKYSGL